MFDEAGKNEFRDRLVEMAKNALLLAIDTKGEVTYVHEKIIEPDDFALNVKMRKFGGVEKELRLHVGGKEVLEEDVADGRIVYKCPLSTVAYIKVRHEDGASSLDFCSSHGFSYKLSLDPYEADYLLSSVLHAIQISEEADTAPSVYIEPANLAMKIHGHSVDMDSIFEVPLKKELEEALKDKDVHNARLKELIFDASINMTLRGIEYDPKFVNALFELLAKYAETLKNVEADPNSYKEYLSYQPGSEGNSIGKEVFEIYQGIPPLLSLVKNCLFWRYSLPDPVIFNNQIEILLALAGSRNSVVSVMASFTLRSLLKVHYRLTTS